MVIACHLHPATILIIGIFTECQGPAKPEVVWSTSYAADVPATNVLVLGRDDTPESWNGPTRNSWLTEQGKTTGQGFVIKVAKSYLKLRLKQTNKFKNKQKDLKSYEGGHPLKSDCKSKSSKYPKVI